MHELSLAAEVIDLASREAKKNDIGSVTEIVVEFGTLAEWKLISFNRLWR